LQLLQALRSSDPAMALPQVEKMKLEEKAVADIKTAFSTVDMHLSSRTFFASERMTIADISYFAVVFAIIKLGHKSLDITSFPALLRLFLTVGSHKAVISVVGDVSMLLSVPKGALGGESEASQTGNFPGKWQRNRIRVKELLHRGATLIGQEVTVQGWVRTSRSADRNQILFVELTDGSTVKGIQLVLEVAKTEGTEAVLNCGGVGASLSVTGLVVASPAKGQTIEIHVTKAKVLGAVYGGDNGEVGGKNYPMAKKQHGLEYLREKAHLRPRSKVFSSAMRLRHAMAFATHKFFNDRGFVYVHTPLITAADCEGAGEQFVVTTLLPEEAKSKDLPVDKAGHVDFSKDFFGRRCCLTVSGQLNVETHACALSDVYTFGPTFRAENSHTARHLAEFWMIEPEICFADLADDMALAVSSPQIQSLVLVRIFLLLLTSMQHGRSRRVGYDLCFTAASCRLQFPSSLLVLFPLTSQFFRFTGGLCEVLCGVRS
jgi:tRNA synthetases class II (D, K and N)/OB-fold nucleic acid binding domain/Glutathione S-transferase, C-terminal domain